jgi:hypothetical protein
MAPLADQHQPAELVLQTFPRHLLRDEELPNCVPQDFEEAAAKLYSVCRYLYKRRSDSIPDVVANIDARTLLIKLHDHILAENWQPFAGNLIDSLTETVEKNEAAKPCRTRGER